jgi:hypothetical protein
MIKKTSRIDSEDRPQGPMNMAEQAPTRRTIGSRSEFHEAVRSAFVQAAAEGVREILLCDPDFADWPLSERAVIEDLTRWARAHRRLLLVAGTFDEVARRHGRWSEWRRTWSHIVECRVNTEIERAQIPTMCLVPGVVAVRLDDAVQHRGIASLEAGDAQSCREAIDAVSQRSDVSFPVTTLGL